MFSFGGGEGSRWLAGGRVTINGVPVGGPPQPVPDDPDSYFRAATAFERAATLGVKEVLLKRLIDEIAVRDVTMLILDYARDQCSVPGDLPELVAKYASGPRVVPYALFDAFFANIKTLVDTKRGNYLSGEVISCSTQRPITFMHKLTSTWWAVRGGDTMYFCSTVQGGILDKNEWMPLAETFELDFHARSPCLLTPP